MEKELWCLMAMKIVQQNQANIQEELETKPNVQI